MTWVKICGTTNVEDAMTAIEAGADALGFVFYEKSPRNIEPATARDIIQQLPVDVEKLGVFVGSYPENWPDVVEHLGLTGTQLHLLPKPIATSSRKAFGMGCFPPGFTGSLSMPAQWLIENEDGARRLVDSIAHAAASLRSIPDDKKLTNLFSTIFIDSGTLQQPGGTGMVFDWDKAAPIVRYMKEKVKIVVSGGLSPTNVTDAIRVLQPWGVDVVSGVEWKPGKKDPEKVRAFVAAVRQSDGAA